MVEEVTFARVDAVDVDGVGLDDVVGDGAAIDAAEAFTDNTLLVGDGAVEAGVDAGDGTGVGDAGADEDTF